MTRAEFRTLLQEGPLLLDGATGSNLMKAGMPRGVCPEQWILEHPQAILDLQSAYAEAGSRIVYAPTFTASEPYLEEHGLETRLEEMNRELVMLSRQAVNGRAFVAGDMTTVGKSGQGIKISHTFQVIIDTAKLFFCLIELCTVRICNGPDTAGKCQHV